MAKAVISALKDKLKQGQRPNKYKIDVQQPEGVQDLKDMNILCSQASFPGVTVQTIEVYQQGRKLVLPGHTEYDNTWEVTCYQTEGHDLRKELIKWKDHIDNFKQNKHQSNPLDSTSGGTSVTQLDAQGNNAMAYEFQGLFPSDIGQVDLSDESQNQIQTFSVTFTYTSWSRK